MKKLYSLMVAAGVSALACSAVNPNPVSPVGEKFGMEVRKAEIGNATNVKYADNQGLKKAAATSNAPATLEGLELNFCYDLIIQDTPYPSSNAMTFTLKNTDGDGIQYYTAKGFMEGMLIDAVTIHEMELLYQPSTGTLVIPAGQTVATYQGVNYDIWNWRDDERLSQVDFQFKYAGSGFEWVNPVDAVIGGQTVSYNSIGMVGGTVIQENGQDVIQTMFIADNLSFRIPQGEMSYTADLIDRQTGQTIPTDVEGALYIEFANGQIILENFGSPTISWVVPFSVDTNAKTITCENVQVDSENGIPVYLSQAKDLFNVWEDDNAYKIVAPYTVADGKTSVEIGEWNAFFYDNAAKEDVNTYVKMYNTKMVFYFDIDAIFASVGNIAVDEADTNAPVEYYNLQGVRVQNPENGLYIRRQGKNVTKVIL